MTMLIAIFAVGAVVVLLWRAAKELAHRDRDKRD